MNILEAFGRRIRYLRLRANLTQERLGEAVHLSAVSISNIERGMYAPAFRRLEDFAVALQVDLHELFLFDSRV